MDVVTNVATPAQHGPFLFFGHGTVFSILAQLRVTQAPIRGTTSDLVQSSMHLLFPTCQAMKPNGLQKPTMNFLLQLSLIPSNESPVNQMWAKVAKKYPFFFFFLVFGPNMTLVMFLWNMDSFQNRLCERHF